MCVVSLDKLQPIRRTPTTYNSKFGYKLEHHPLLPFYDITQYEGQLVRCPSISTDNNEFTAGSGQIVMRYMAGAALYH